jgi:Zn-dependent M28 family amino/carboxypeptidase
VSGSEAALRDEYVVYTAHLDHLGIGRAINGDNIYNGAVDNAAGVAGLIEIARAFTRLPHPPRRSLLFIAVTAEDAGSIGMLGSDYFAHYPTVPANSIIADVNIDGLPFGAESRDVIAYGGEHSSLGGTVERAARQLGMEVTPDPWPEQAFFVRSDQYSFVRKGVPSVFIMKGIRYRDPRIDGKKRALAWWTTHYHLPNDDMKQPLNFQSMARGARLQFLVGDLVADSEQKPTWNKNDFFGETFARR